MVRDLAAAALAMTLVSSPAVPQTPQDPEGEDRPEIGFSDAITVALVPIVVRVVDRRGAPIRGLGPADLIARVGKHELPITALDWYASGRSGLEIAETATEPGTLTDPEPRTIAEVATARPDVELPGDLVVVFVQIGHHMVVTLDESWVGGHLKALPHLRKLVRGLDPEDRVAVVSFDARLKLWQDFTRDREAVADALYRAIGFGEPGRPRRVRGPSLMDHFDFRAARRATNTEAALEVLGEALEPLPGSKDVIFAGWGLGRFVAGVGVSYPPSYYDALDALEAARTTVSVLDVTQASGHALASGLRSMAEATGGTYASTYDFGARKVEELARTLSGYYLLTIDRSALPEVRGKLVIELRNRKGRILYRPTDFD